MRRNRAIAPHVSHVSHLRRQSLLLTACDLSSEIYKPFRTDGDVYLTNVDVDVEAVVGHRICAGRRFLTVTFCGTERLADWCHNLMLWTITPKGAEGRVHAGFSRRWEAVSDKVMRLVDRVHADRILVTGHSLGGAVATLAAPDLARAFAAVPVTLITFGAPQTANARFHAQAPPTNLVKSVRCVHVGDIVQLFPPFPWYCHPSYARVVIVGQESEAARSEFGAESDVFDKWGNVLWLQLQRVWRRKFNLAHHQIFEYRRELTLAEARGCDIERQCGRRR